MSTLITGGCGFIGSHLVEHLLGRNEQVTVLDNLSSGSRGNLPEHDRLTLLNGDVRDESVVSDAVDGVDRVYHLAAAVGVENVVENPLQSLSVNVQGTENVLEACRPEQTPVFLASSSEVYGKTDSVPFSEENDRVLGPTTVPRWGYAAAKAVDEFLGLAYHDKHDVPVVSGRYFNVVGPRQSGEYGMVVPTFVDQALAGDPLTVYGDGTQTRSFTHVSDAVRATHDLLNTREAHGGVFNIGAPDPVEIERLARRIIEATGSDSQITHVPFEEVYGPDFEEPSRRRPDVSKLRETIGWGPSGRLDDIVEDVIAARRQGDR